MRALRVPVVVGLLFAVLWIAGSGAHAQQSKKPKYPPVTPSVLPSVLTSPIPSPSVVPSPEPSVEPSRGPEPRDPLPFTGADLTLFAATGFAAVGTGTVLVRATRSRRSR